MPQNARFGKWEAENPALRTMLGILRMRHLSEVGVGLRPRRAASLPAYLQLLMFHIRADLQLAPG